MQTKPSIEPCFSVTFDQKPSPKFLDIAESQWISRLNEQIDIIKTLFPKITLIFYKNNFRRIRASFLLKI